MHRKIASQLAEQMTAAGITPENVATHPAYCVSAGRSLLLYAQEGRRWVLGLHACSLQADGNDWLCFDDFGAEYTRIAYNGTTWVAA